MSESKTSPSPLVSLYRFFTSFKLATIVLVFMTIVTLLGTLSQPADGLHASKLKYFHSWFFIEKLGPIPIPLPGGLLLMIILFINMTLGALVKVRKRWKGVGLLISHFGMLMLLAGGFVTWAFKTDGYMALYEGQTSNRVESYRDWQIEIRPLTEDRTAESAYVFGPQFLQSMDEDEKVVVDVPGEPFTLAIEGYSPNGAPYPESSPRSSEAQTPIIDGFRFVPEPKLPEVERNLPGAYLTIQPQDGSDPIETILWAGSSRFDPGDTPLAFPFEVAGKPYAALLVKETWTVPFNLTLNEFIFEKHPGTTMARNYESRVVRLEEGETDQPVHIKMNEPMRYQGHTFFQESYGPSDAKPGEPMFSQFAVATNPADQWPLWALVVTSIGLLIHFIYMLVSFIMKAVARSKEARMKRIA